MLQLWYKKMKWLFQIKRKILMVKKREKNMFGSLSCRTDLLSGACSLICCVLLVFSLKLDHNSSSRVKSRWISRIWSLLFDLHYSEWLFFKVAFVQRYSSFSFLLATSFTYCESKTSNSPSLTGANCFPVKLEQWNKTLLFYFCALAHFNYLQNIARV